MLPGLGGLSTFFAATAFSALRFAICRTPTTTPSRTAAAITSTTNAEVRTSFLAAVSGVNAFGAGCFLSVESKLGLSCGRRDLGFIRRGVHLVGQRIFRDTACCRFFCIHDVIGKRLKRPAILRAEVVGLPRRRLPGFRRHFHLQ